MCEFLFNVYLIGTAGDSLGYHNGMKFTTQDVDNDLWPGYNCAQSRHGAWWFNLMVNGCSLAHLNGEYLRGRHNWGEEGILWYYFKGWYYSYKVAEMKVALHKN